MSDIDKLAQGIADLSVKIDRATAETKNAAQDAEDAAGTAEVLGADHVADTLDQVKDELTALAAVLQNASNQAMNVRALAKSVGNGKGSGASGPLQVPPASSDPAAATSGGTSKSYSAKSKSERARRLAAKSAKKTEDVQDLVDTVQEGINAATDQLWPAPNPPEIASTNTQVPSSPSGPSGAPGAGIEASSVAGALIGVVVATMGSKEVWRRRHRATRTPEQFPDEPRPPASG